MLENAWDTLGELIQRGGWVMYPLVVLSIVSLALVFERCWFWLALNNPWRMSRFRRVARHIRDGNTDAARALIDGDRSVYGNVVEQVLDEGTSEAVMTLAVERQRARMDRFMPTLGTIITAAPMLGILGTVTGIIGALQVLSEGGQVTDPDRLGAEIAEALLTTVAGLVVALIVLFPFNAFRAQIDRTLGRIEMLFSVASREEQAAAE